MSLTFKGSISHQTECKHWASRHPERTKVRKGLEYSTEARRDMEVGYEDQTPFKGH